MDVNTQYSFLGLRVSVDEELSLPKAFGHDEVELSLIVNSARPKESDLIYQQNNLQIFHSENSYYFEYNLSLPDKRHLQSMIIHDILPACLSHKGHFLIHGACVAYKDQAHIVAGFSGMGKSTLSAQLIQHNMNVISDDIVRLEAHMGSFQVYGLNILRSFEEYPFHRIYSQPVFQKFHYLLSGVESSYRLRSISILASEAGNQNAVHSLQGTHALLDLLPHVFVSNQPTVNLQIMDELLSVLSMAKIYKLSSAAKHYPASEYMRHLPNL